MSSKKQTCSIAAGGYFVASFIHPKTGERIYAKDYGKRAFFIPYKAKEERQKRQGDAA